MRPALLFCAHTPKHAAPREPLAPSSRHALAVGLAAALLPLAAAPALADDAPDTTSTVAASTTSTSTEVLAAAAPAAAAVPVAAAPAAAPARVAAPATTTLAFSAPSTARSTRVQVGVRLLADGHAVRNGYVRLEKSTGSGWSYAGRLLTNGGGNGSGTLRVTGGASLRAVYPGASTRTRAVSAVRTVSAPRVVASSGSSDLRARALGRTVLAVAARYVGTPYRYGASGPSAFDCSGFTRFVYARLGVSLPHNSSAQGAVTRRVSKASARPGDLLVMPGHVGIYAGGGRMYDAPHRGSYVSLRAIYTSSYTVHRVL